MQTYAVIASGQSLTDEDVEYVRAAREDGRLSGVVAISNVGIDKAPWADILVSYDTAWWSGYPEAFNFKGEKYARSELRGVKAFKAPFTGCNSGLVGMYVAEFYGAEKIILLGFDMHGTHYFGKHERLDKGAPLKNQNDGTFRGHRAQFRRWRGCPVINCTPDSALDFFPKQDLRGSI